MTATGKVGKNAAGNMTLHCGTNETALLTLEKTVQEYQQKGYVLVEGKKVGELVVFDKAKWHFQGDFPQDLDIFQAYVPTGFYIG